MNQILYELTEKICRMLGPCPVSPSPGDIIYIPLSKVFPELFYAATYIDRFRDSWHDSYFTVKDIASGTLYAADSWMWPGDMKIHQLN